MRHTKMNQSLKRGLLCASIGLALAGLTSSPVLAWEFSSDDNEITGNIDTTISYGISWRARDAKDSEVAKAVNNPTDRKSVV